MKKYIVLSGLLSACALTFAQGESDLLRNSLTDISGSARYVAMSGAFGALGGDMSVLGMNPAGIAVFRSSEFSMTPSLSMSSTKSVLENKESSDSRAKLLMNNFGYVGSFRTYDESAITNFNFGISYNKIRDFNRSFLVKGVDRPFSLLNRICYNQPGTAFNEDNLTDLGYMAYNTALINPNVDNQGTYYTPVMGDAISVDNTMKMKESGGVNEWNLSLGANYSHVFYLGMSLGIQSIDYKMISTYEEQSLVSSPGFDLGNVLSTVGSGVNLKIGAIVRPFPELRLGFAYHSSTYYDMKDDFAADMYSHGVSDGSGNTEFGSSISESYTDYQYQTPSRLLYSVAYQFGQKGFLSLDWDVVDYRELTLKDVDGFPYENINDYMSKDFRAASNLRLGAEYRLTDNVSLRAGAAWYQSPVKTSVREGNTEFATVGSNTAIVGVRPNYSMENDTYYLSGGIGYRTGAFFLDAALQRQMRSEDFYSFYDETKDANYSKYSKLNTNKTNLVVSLGFKF